MAPGPALRARPARARILVAGNGPAARRAARTLSARRSFAVETAADAAAALGALDERRVDLALVDLGGLDDVAGALRRWRAGPGTGHVPVILLLRAAARGESRIEALAAGPDDYVLTPFAARELVARVTTQLGLRARRRATAAEDATDRARLPGAVEDARAQAEAANRLKDEFLATLSHELRTPLNAIVGWVHLLRAGRLDPATTHRALETIDRNARIQTHLISDILDVSRIAAGKLRVRLRPLELPPILGAALDTVRVAAEAKGIRLGLAVDPLAGPVLGDPDRLQQVVWNLLSNAVKFTPARGTIEVALVREGVQAALRIRDDGAGIAPEFLPFVFERFRQGDPSSTRPQGGLGLGLAIARHLAEVHGGTVTAESAGPGLGATFTLRLPLMDAAKTAVQPPRPAAVLGATGFPGPTLEGVSVLLADGDPDDREWVCAVLRESGADVVPAASAEEALETIRRLRPDVLLVRLDHGDEESRRLIRAVREMPPDRGGLTPAAVVSDGVATEERLQSLLAGYQVHLVRPLHPPELAATIASLAGRTRVFP